MADNFRASGTRIANTNPGQPAGSHLLWIGFCFTRNVVSYCDMHLLSVRNANLAA